MINENAGTIAQPSAQPPIYNSLFPPISAPKQNANQIKEYVKAQIMAENLRRAGNQGSNPWTTTEVVGAVEPGTTPGTAVPIMTEIPGLLSPLPFAIPQHPVIDPAILTQPHSMLNIKAANDGSPQVVNHEITYFAPTYVSNDHRECINCCEDCCEDLCENMCLNCCLDCSKVLNSPNVSLRSGQPSSCFGLFGNRNQYSVLNEGQPPNPLLNPMVGLLSNYIVNGQLVCPIHANIQCPVTQTPTPGCVRTIITTVLPFNPLTGCPNSTDTVCANHGTKGCPDVPMFNGKELKTPFKSE